jgi:predicted DNA-binding transcriptional regulator AlpA
MNAPARASTIDPLLHPRDVARILNVSTSWLAKSRLSGNGPRFVKIGRAVRYPESCLREYIKGRTRGRTSEQ